jgi:hypothetical protein
MRTLPTTAAMLACALLSSSAAALDVESKGELGAESRLFWPDKTKDTYLGNAAIAGRLQADTDLDEDGDTSARARMFFRLDPGDDVRTLVVPEELYLSSESELLRIRVGYQMINWTATEAFHPADVINSRILDGNFENPEKIGEPIAAARLEIPNGNVEVFAMPLFTAPVLPSARSPLSFGGAGVGLGEALVLDRSGRLTENRLQPQWGAQVQQTWGDADIALHVVQQIDRAMPLIVIDPVAARAHPVFQSVTQLGGTYQHAAFDGTMLKLEAAYRIYDRPDGGVFESSRPLVGIGPVPIPRRNHVMAAAGVEQSLSRGDGSETSLLLEGQALIDVQGDYPELLQPLFQNDVLIGMRHAFNDEQSTSFLATAIIDVKNPEQLVMGASLSRRLGDDWGLTTGLRFLRVPPKNPAAPVLFENLNDKHQVYIDLKRYF